MNSLVNMLFCCFLLVAPVTSLLAATNAKQYDVSNIQWSKLSYSTKVLLFLRLSADIHLEVLDSDEIKPELISSSHGKGLFPKNEKAVLLTMLSNNLGRKSKLNLWLDEDLTSLQRTQLDTSKRFRRKTYRFLENGVYGLENKPLKKEVKLPVESWSNTSEYFYEADPEFVGDPVTDDTALFYAISSSTRLNNPGDKIQIVTFDKKENFIVDITVMGDEDVKVKYVEERNGNERVVKGRVDALKLLLTARPHKNSEIETKFLDLNKGIEIYLDKKTRTILKISADLKYVGRVNVRLDRVSLN